MRRISLIATAEPVRDFSIVKTVTKERAIMIVFIEPTMKRKERLSGSVSSEAITAA